MINMVIALLLGTLCTLALNVLADVNLWLSMLAGLAVFTVAYILLIRYVMKKVSDLMEIAQRDLQAGRFEKAVKTMESGYKYSSWQFFVRPQLNAQIGTILYLKRDFGTAFDYLKKAFVRHWVAQAMLAICYMKRNKPSQMIDTFEKATTVTRKEPLLWNLYAYCLEYIGERGKAIEVLERGLKKVGSNETLQENVEALREGKKMKMRDYGDMWYQFHLEKPGALIKQQTRAIQGRRKIVRR